MIPGSTLHFHTRFDLRPKDPSAKAADVVDCVRAWVQRRFPAIPLGGTAFVEGWSSPPIDGGRLRLATAAESGSGSKAEPQWWAMRLEHPCRQVTFRQWRVDIGLTRRGGDVLVAVSVSNWVLPSYIGPELEAPAPSAPGVIAQLIKLKTKGWVAMSGAMPLSDEPLDLPPGLGDKVVTMLTDGEREAPLVLVSRLFPSGDIPLAVENVARLMAGAATFFVSQGPDVDKELEALLPTHLRCWGGRVRVYQPGAKVNYEPDGRRHRFFHPQEIETLGHAEVERRLVAGIARRPKLRTSDGVASIEDVFAKQREVRLQALKAELGDSKDKEYLLLYAEDNESLRGEVKQLRQEIDDLLLRAEQAEDDRQAAEAQKQTAWAERSAALKQVQATEARLAALGSLREMPRTLPAIVQMMADLHGHRLAFTPDAIASANEASYCDRPNELADAWRALFEMATTLHDIFFQEQANEVEKPFVERTGIEIAMAETKATQKNPKLMRLRRQSFEGREIDIVPHVKLGTDQRPFRIHFAVDREKQRIVVGHCGDHLDTAGTRRR